MSAGPAIEAEGLTFRFAVDEPPVLRGLALSLAAGERVAVMGPSGSGKSTLLSVLACLRGFQAGSVRLLGRDVGGLTPPERDALRARCVGLVFQRAHLLPFLSVRGNVALGLTLSGQPAAAAAVDEAVRAVGLGALAERRAGALSVGEAQRVAVARALVKRPPLLLADEPTGALDAGNAGRVMDFLLGPDPAGAPRTVLVATHDPRVADRCDRIVHLRDGALG